VLTVKACYTSAERYKRYPHLNCPPFSLLLISEGHTVLLSCLPGGLMPFRCRSSFKVISLGICRYRRHLAGSGVTGQ